MAPVENHEWSQLYSLAKSLERLPCEVIALAIRGLGCQVYHGLQQLNLREFPALKEVLAEETAPVLLPLELRAQEAPLSDSDLAEIEEFLRNGAEKYSREDFEEVLLICLERLCQSCARSSRVVSAVFPLIRGHLREMERYLLDCKPREYWHLVGDEWAFVVGAFVHALAVEPDDAVAAELADWLEDHCCLGLCWVQPAFVHPRRQKAVATLMAKYKTARLDAFAYLALRELCSAAPVSGAFLLAAERAFKDHGHTFNRRRALCNKFIANRPLSAAEGDCLFRLEAMLRAWASLRATPC